MGQEMISKHVMLSSVFSTTQGQKSRHRKGITLAHLLCALQISTLLCLRCHPTCAQLGGGGFGGAPAEVIFAAWGKANRGGDVSATTGSGVNQQSPLPIVIPPAPAGTTVVAATCSLNVCAASFSDGSARVWGKPALGGPGDLTSGYRNGGQVTIDLSTTTLGAPNKEVTEISCGENACLVLYSDATADAWGNFRFGGDSNQGGGSQFIPDTGIDLANGGTTTQSIVGISCGANACAVRILHTDTNTHSAAVWGSSGNGGDIDVFSALQSLGAGPAAKYLISARDVQDISCGDTACVARFQDGSARAWGNAASGGDIAVGPDVTPASDYLAAGVEDISCGGYACVARFVDGSAKAWGNALRGGNVGTVDLSGTPKVVDISCGARVCAARFADGSAATWGLAAQGGDSSSVDLSGTGLDDGTGVDLSGDTVKAFTIKVLDISCGGSACVARFSDGSGAAWGMSGRGGDITVTGGPNPVDLTGATKDVVDITCGSEACAARFSDGSGAAWGKADMGGDITQSAATGDADYSFHLNAPSGTGLFGTPGANVASITCGVFGSACLATFDMQHTTTCGDKTGFGGGPELSVVTDAECNAGPNSHYMYNPASDAVACAVSLNSSPCDLSAIGFGDHPTCCKVITCDSAELDVSVVIVEPALLDLPNFAVTVNTVTCVAGYDGTAGTNPTACTVDGEKWTYTKCAAVSCPPYSTGTNVALGCTCDRGGTITASLTAPFFTGSCDAPPALPPVLLVWPPVGPSTSSSTATSTTTTFASTSTSTSSSTSTSTFTLTTIDAPDTPSAATSMAASTNGKTKGSKVLKVSKSKGPKKGKQDAGKAGKQAETVASVGTSVLPAWAYEKKSGKTTSKKGSTAKHTVKGAHAHTKHHTSNNKRVLTVMGTIYIVGIVCVAIGVVNIVFMLGGRLGDHANERQPLIEAALAPSPRLIVPASPHAQLCEQI